MPRASPQVSTHQQMMYLKTVLPFLRMQLIVGKKSCIICTDMTFSSLNEEVAIFILQNAVQQPAPLDIHSF
jgi:hypothetical protein